MNNQTINNKNFKMKKIEKGLILCGASKNQENSKKPKSEDQGLKMLNHRQVNDLLGFKKWFRNVILQMICFWSEFRHFF